MNACRLFILAFGKKYALLSWLEMSLWLGTFGFSRLRYRSASGVRLGRRSAQFKMAALGGPRRSKA